MVIRVTPKYKPTQPHNTMDAIFVTVVFNSMPLKHWNIHHLWRFVSQLHSWLFCFVTLMTDFKRDDAPYRCYEVYLDICGVSLSWLLWALLSGVSDSFDHARRNRTMIWNVFNDSQGNILLDKLTQMCTSPFLTGIFSSLKGSLYFLQILFFYKWWIFVIHFSSCWLLLTVTFHPLQYE